MTRKFFASLICAAFSALLLVGCSQIPTQELADAQAALDSAQVAEADRYAVEEFQAAQDSLLAAEAEIEAKNYDRAVALLAFVTETANAAKEAVPAKKEEVRTQVQELLAQATTAVEAFKAEAAKVSKTPAEPVGTVSPIAAIEADLQAAVQANEAGDFATAREKAQAALDALSALKAAPAPAATVQS